MKQYRTFLQNKLWRDLMPEKAEAQGSVLEIKSLSDEAYDMELRNKLREEAVEVYSAGSRAELVEELADVLEVIDAILVCQQISKDELLRVQAQKKESKGGFQDRKYIVTAKHLTGSALEHYCLNAPDKYPEVLDN